MKHDDAEIRPFASHRQLMMWFAGLTVALTVSLPRPAHADDDRPPRVPPNLQVPAGNKVFLEGDAIGTQDYICLPSGAGFAFTFFAPQATLFDHDEQIITHFLSPNPVENGTPRVTWRDSEDSSTVWAVTIAQSSDPAFVRPGAIPWFLLRVVGARAGPTGGDKLSKTTFVQRLNTSGGVAPSTGCTVPTDVGKVALVPYTATYFFFRAVKDK